MIFFLALKTFVCLFATIFSSHFLVKSTAKIAAAFSIPSYIISLTILAIGTSIAEIVTSVQSILVTQSLQMTLGNVVGSNVFNTTISYAVLLLFTKKHIEIKKNDQFFSIISFAIFIAVAHFAAYNSIVALALFAMLIFYYYISFKNGDAEEEESSESYNVFFCFAMFAASLAGIVYSSKYFIQSSVDLAHLMNVSDYIIGMTIVAIGTSFPELITTISALWQKKPEIALGNIIGSNIFNVLGILGIVIPLYEWFTTNEAIMNVNLLDLIMLSVCTFSIIFTIYIKQIFYKFIGFLLIISYFLYLYMII